MTIRIRISGPDAATELSSLYTWLCDDHDVRQHARISLLTAEPEPADMGIAFDVIQLVVDSGFQAASLAVAYAAWRAARPNPPQATLEHDGVTVPLDGSESETSEVVAKALE